MKKSIGILGAGSWATAMAQSFARNGANVTLWHRLEKIANRIQETRINRKYFPDITLYEGITVTHDWKMMCQNHDIIILAIPTSQLPYFLKHIFANVRSDQVILNASKGLDHEHQQTISHWIAYHFDKQLMQKHYGVLSGPSFALEVIQDKPTGIMIAHHDPNICEEMRQELHSDHFQLFATHDVIGVEIAGAMKNVIAITVGASDVLGYGHNTRAGLLTKGQEEISQIGLALGAKRETFWGLAGMGDLILTCTGDLSRNRRVGKKLAEGKTIRQILKELGQIAEGIRTTKTAHKMAKHLDLSTPILRETYRAMFKGKPLQEAVETILQEMK